MTSDPAVKRGRGRPSEGVRVDIRIPADLLARIDAMAGELDIRRAAVIRLLLLDHPALGGAGTRR